MIPRLFRQIAVPIIALVLLMGLVLFLLLRREACLGDAVCVRNALLMTVALGVVGALAAAWLVSSRIARPLNDVAEVARRIAAGDGTARALTQRRDEIGDLVRAFSAMTEQQRERIEELSRDYRRFVAVIEHMADGVIIIDRAGNVVLINPAACRLMNTHESDALGRSFAAVARHHALIELWQRGRREQSEQVEAVEISPKLFLQAVLTPYSRAEGAGFIVLLQDLTQVRRLQVMRRDFISNLSHELRSPLASLRAVVETLQDGALDDPPAAERFCGRRRARSTR